MSQHGDVTELPSRSVSGNGHGGGGFETRLRDIESRLRAVELEVREVKTDMKHLANKAWVLGGLLSGLLGGMGIAAAIALAVVRLWGQST